MAEGAAPDVVAFGFEDDLLARFWALEEAVNAADPWWGRLPGRDERAQLAPSAPFFAEGGRHRAFLATGGGDDLGRVVAMVSPGLADPDGTPVGLLGFWECRDDDAAAAALLEAGLAWLRDAGAKRVLGPLNGSTWHRYRFVTGGRDGRGPFLLEPWTAAWYPRQWEAAGFAPHQTYASIQTLHPSAGLLPRSYERALAAGVRFEDLAEAGFAARSRTVYDLARRIFAGKTAYRAIGYAEFQGLTAGLDALVQPGLCHLAYDRDDRAIGFFFGYPDALGPLARVDPGGPVETTVLKTLAVDPAGGRYLGWALTHLHAEAARARGMPYGIYALMEKHAEILRYARRGGHLDERCGEVRRYTLYERAV